MSPCVTNGLAESRDSFIEGKSLTIDAGSTTDKYAGTEAGHVRRPFCADAAINGNFNIIASMGIEIGTHLPYFFHYSINHFGSGKTGMDKHQSNSIDTIQIASDEIHRTLGIDGKAEKGPVSMIASDTISQIMNHWGRG